MVLNIKIKDPTLKNTNSTKIFGLFSFNLAVALAALSAYAHYIGYSYRSAFLEAAGIDSSGLVLTSYETIRYAGQFLSYVFQNLSSFTSIFKYSLLFAVIGLIFFVFTLVDRYSMRSPIRDCQEPESSNNNTEPRGNLDKRLRLLYTKNPDSHSRNIFTAICVGGILSVLHFAVAFIFLAFIALVLLTVSLGEAAGIQAGNNFYLSSPCMEVDKNQMKAAVLPGCEIFNIKKLDGNSDKLVHLMISGKQVTTISGHRFVLTNDALYELDQNLNVIKIKPKIKKD